MILPSKSKQLQTQSLHSQQSDQVMFTQSRDPNNKTKPAYKKYCSYCHRTNHSISACFKKQRDDEDKRDTYARSKSPQKSVVQYFRSSPNDETQRYDTRPTEYPNEIVVEVHPVTTIKNITDNVLLQELAIITIELPLLHITLDLVMTTIFEILAHIVHHIDLQITLQTWNHVPVKNLDHTQEITTFHDTLLLIDHHLDVEVLDILDLARIHRHETKSIKSNHKLLLTQSTLK